MSLSRGPRVAVAVPLILLMIGGRLAAAGQQTTPSPASASVAPAVVPAGTVSGFVRINGDALPLRYVYAFIAPDTMKDGVMVTLLMASSMAFRADALAAATTRRELTQLLVNGALLELTPAGGHAVFLRHGALRGQEIQADGDLSLTANTDTHVTGRMVTSSPGDERKLGFAIRFEITFDAPVIRTISALR